MGRGGSGIGYYIAGPDIQKLDEYSNQLVEKLRADNTFRDADRSLELGSPEIRVEIDRAKAADLGVQAGDVAQALNVLSAGQRVSTFSEGTDQYDVLVQADEPFRRTRDNLEYFTVASSKGGTIGLEKLVTIKEGLSSGFDQPFEPAAAGHDFREFAAERFRVRRARRVAETRCFAQYAAGISNGRDRAIAGIAARL